MALLGWAVLFLMLALNTLLIALPLSLLGMEPERAVGWAVSAVTAYGVLAISPVGEWLCRRGFRKPKPEEEKVLRPAYEKVLARAGWQGKPPDLLVADRGEEVHNS
ncbi:hypothetical protein Adeg_0723 [Ammonifex degensii KC4]|uniref:Uncharacterized protein n=1 Tax=Ammonifex degensii (strain DSM 10501 / KC4) TaxID=429009 RepID=C9RC93_AMMDK|nr:hypothetical protein [Ammonifex degensii]ACX51870.1 hypothetical protein Adeg_0723 [Ammonifex degensii KC4]